MPPLTQYGLKSGMAWSFGMVRAEMWECRAQYGRQRQGVPCSGSEDPGSVVMAAHGLVATWSWCRALATVWHLAVPG